MKKLNCAALALFAAACGGADGTSLDAGLVAWEVGLPPGVARIDGTVDEDHIFHDENHREIYCGLFPESPACAELGTAEQAWVSGEYHGVDDASSNIACYTSASANGPCVFPRHKRLKYVFDTTNCFPTFSDANHDPVSALQGSAIRAGTESGMTRWHGSASGVSVENNACSTGTCMTVNVSCANLTQSDGRVPFGVGGYSGATTTQVSNLPAGPHGGIDQTAGRTRNAAHLTIDPGKILDYYVDNCGDGTPTRGELSDFARFIAAHELGHVFGFGHFGNGPDNLMFPSANCADIAAPVVAPFAAALAVYAPTGDSDATVLDVNLEAQGP